MDNETTLDKTELLKEAVKELDLNEAEKITDEILCFIRASLKAKDLARKGKSLTGYDIKSYLLSSITFPMYFRGVPKMKDIESHLGLKESSVRRRMKDDLGCTFNELIREIKVDFAKSMILDERNSIRDTAIACGFDESPQFHRFFKTHTSMSPTEYRDCY